MDDLDSLDDLELDLQKKSEDKSTIMYIKVFGWITFGIGLIYLLISFVRLIMMSMMSAFTQIIPDQNEAFEFIDRIVTYQKLLSYAALILSALFVLGGIGYALRREWGRKLYMIVCTLGICYHLFSGYITFFTLTDFDGPMSQSTRNEVNLFTTSFSSVMWIITGLIPIAYLAINLILAGRSKTKSIMK